MTFRRVLSYGLIAGMNMGEIRHSRPGLVIDLFSMRIEYDKMFVLKL